MKVIFLLFTTVTVVLSQTLTRPLTFEIQPGASTLIGYSASTGGSDSETVTMTGSLAVNLSFDQESLSPQTIELTGGSIYYSSFSLNVGTNVFYSGAGTHFTNLSTSGSNWRETLSTPNPPGQIDSQTGLVTNSEHRITIDQGTTTVSISVPSLNIFSSETTNYAVTPLTSEPSGSTSISLVETNSTLFERSIQATLTSSINESEVQSIDGTNLSLTLSENGSFTALEDFSIPTPYGQWALDNNLGEPQPDETNESGIPYGLLFAFDLTLDHSELPIEVIQTETGTKARLTLPNTGLASTVVPLYSPDLSSDFQPLNTEFYDDGADALDAGKSTTTLISFPASSKGFLRFTTDL